MKRLMLAVACTLAIGGAAAGAAQADFPYLPNSASAGDPFSFKSGPGVVPSDLDGNDWKFAATPENPNPYPSEPKELDGVRGAHLVDANAAVHTAWQTTTGRPDVTIAVLDSGIEWQDPGAMNDLRFKVRLNKGELPKPEVGGPTNDTTAAASCAGFTAGQYDANGDGVFNARDYACDPRVTTTTGPRVGPPGKLTPQDLIIAFSQGAFHGDGDGNGYVDDIAGWDFLDNDNDAYDDVHYGHGTGEATDSSAEANNGGETGSCPNCTFIPLRVGDSFVADVNRFAQASLYAVDNDVLVIQEALGTLNNSTLARKAVDYAYEHGVAVMASAADEAAQHHNWPSSLPHTIVTNSVRKYDSTFTPAQKSYVEFNGCTNFSSKVTVAIPSSSCSSNAVGLAAGMAGLIYSAAIDARNAGHLDPSEDAGCARVSGGGKCLITPNEVRQLIASGRITPGNAGAGDPHDTEDQADDVNFISGTEPSCSGVPSVDCTDPNRFFLPANAAITGRPVASVTPFATRGYPAHKGFDQYYGYGRVNMVKAVDAVDAATIPPEAEITSPEWYEQIAPDRPNVDVHGYVNARGHDYTCVVEVAPGSDPTNDADFQQVTSSDWCDGTTQHSAEHSGALAQVNLTQLKGKFPPLTDFTGAAPTASQNTTADGPHQNNRPAKEPYGFTVRLRVTSVQGAKTLRGEDRRNMYLHRDAGMKAGFPKEFGSDGASSPALVDLDGDNRNEMVFGSSDGIVHALKPDGTEAAGFPVHTDPLPLHAGEPAFGPHEVPTDTSFGAILSSVAVGDINHDGVPEVVASDLEGKVYVWKANGDLEWKREANPAYSGRPLQPFENVRCPIRCRTQHGFIASPVLANLDGSADGKLDVIAAGMDRHVYAWDASGSDVPGYPVLVVDRDKVQSIDAQTHVPTFKPDIGDPLNQGAIVDTPAVGDLTGDDGKLEIVVGTNEEYPAGDDGGLNAGTSSGSLAFLSQAGGSLGLSPANSRVYAIKSTGDPSNGAPSMTNSAVFIDGWPKKVGVLLAELLPVVGEGITGSPVIGGFTCPSGGAGNKVGTIPGVGPGYIFNADGTSCYGQESDGTTNRDRTLAGDGQGFSPQGPAYDHPAIPAVGHPAFGKLDPAGTVSFLAPAAGVIRALDAAFPEYQGGQDFTVAWKASTGQFEAGWPVPVNDLQFLTGPSVADVDGQPGQESVGGTASLDLNALTYTGAPATGFPKLTSDWMVTNPVIGSFGTLDVDASAHNVVGALTRRGTLFAYDTPAPVCPLGSWPRFHHDNANSGVLDRDAVAPGRPFEVSAGASGISFRAPGDDLLCGNATRYEAVQSDSPIDAGNFDAGDPLPVPAPAAPGTTLTLALPAGAKRYVAIRAVDDANNVGRVAAVDRTQPPDTSGGGAGNPDTPAGPGGQGNAPGENGGNGPANNGGGGSATGCSDRSAPRSTISRRALHASGRSIRVRGRSRDRGCAGIRREYVSIALVRGTSCRFLTRRGKLTARRRCRRPVLIRTHGTKRWSLRVSGRLHAGRYRLVARGVDRKGNKERPRRRNSMHFRVR